MLFKKLQKFFFNEGGEADSLERGINEDSRKKADVDISIRNIRCKGDDENEGHHEHEKLSELRIKEKAENVISVFIRFFSLFYVVNRPFRTL